MTSLSVPLPPPGVRFTKKERELFETLATHVNCVLSRAYLLRHVWGYSEGTRTRTVDVHIRRLRKKLAETPGVRISTVIGKGYMMETVDRPVAGTLYRAPAWPGDGETPIKTASAGS